MELLSTLTASLGSGHDLSAEEAASAAAAMASDGPSDDARALFLSALSRKGETAAEIAAFARTLRELATDPGISQWSSRALDIVGTGGDHSGGFNVSSMVALVVACAGVPVMKHGNRGITSKCGSADLFEALGVQLVAPPALLRAAIARLGFVFLFAPNWYPAFKRIAPVRKRLAASGERTIFNVLGPLLNPGRPAHVLLGAATPALVEKLADALEDLGTPAALAVHGIIAPGLGIDELTTATTNLVRGVGRLRSTRGAWKPESFGLAVSPFSDVAGGDIGANVATAGSLARGGGPRGLSDTIALNAAAALWVAGARPDVRGAVAEARELLLGGAVLRKMDDTRDFYTSRGATA